jgi:NitT/TauT family transport system substrate-binding protein
MKKFIGIILIISMCFMLASCQQVEEASNKKIVIAQQFGLAYAPLQIMQTKGYLESALPGYDIEWVKLGNTAAIREAILADALDVGFLGIPPFLIGYENGMDWGIFTGLSSAPLGLVTSNSAIETLEDIASNDRIALPQPGSIQHILLSMAADQTFGQADYFDKQLVTMKHPDGMNALMSGGEVTLHFTSPPFLFEELEQEDLSLVIDGESCFGSDFTFIVGMTTGEFKKDEVAYHALKEAVTQSVQFMEDQPEETITLLQAYYDYDAEKLRDYVYNRGITYTTDVQGLERFIEFMKDNALLENTIPVEEVLW